MDMVKVKTLKVHHNTLGKKQEKAEGDVYEAPREIAEMLIGGKLVEEVTEPARTK